MKRKSTSVLLLIGILSLVIPSARGQLFEVGDKDLNFTIGYGTPWVIRHDYRTMLPPITVSFDLGFRDDLGPGILSIGGLVGATTYRNIIVDPDWNPEYGKKSTTLIGAIRSTYHYQFLDKLDTYGGVHLGLRYESWREYGSTPADYVMDIDITIRPIFNLFVGAKYYFSDNIFALGEIGYSIAFINIGVGIRL